MRGAGAGSPGRLARFRRAVLQTEAKLEERSNREHSMNGLGWASLRENRIAGARANGKAGASNRYGCYFSEV
jgi:hypothetical protein